MNTPILKLENITKVYNAPEDGDKYTVFNDIHLEVLQGDMLGIMGPSGSGKSTLLNIIGALDAPTSGSVIFDGQAITEQSQDTLAKIRNLQIGFIFQLHHLLPQCTLLDNVLMPLLSDYSNVETQASKDFAIELLDRIGLADRKNHYPAQLSGGQRQRAAFARALINRPKLLLADEPTGSLDQENANALMELMVEVNKEIGTTLIVVSHWDQLHRYLHQTVHLADGALTAN